jgi:hypothetical protein
MRGSSTATMFRVWHLTKPLVARAMVKVYAKAKAEMLTTVKAR